MKAKFAILQRIDNDRRITKDADPEFFRQLTDGLMLALHERGNLSAQQYRLAADQLAKRSYQGG